MTTAEYDRGLEDGAALAHRDAFVLVRELREKNERLRAIAVGVAALSPWAYAQDGRYCFFCQQSEWETPEHKPSCPWLCAKGS